MTRTVPVWPRHKTRTGRLWTYVRDDKPFGGPAPPAAVFFYSRDRAGEHPERHLAGYAGILQADAYAGFNRLYDAGPQAGADHRGGCWAHAPAQVLRACRRRRQGAGKLAVIAPLAFEAVKRIDALFAIEREINGRPSTSVSRCAASAVAPLVADLETWMRSERAKLSATARSPRRSTTCSSAGTRSRASSTTAASA